MRISVLMVCLAGVLFTAVACAQTPPAPPAPPEPPEAPVAPEPPLAPASVGAPGERNLQDKVAEVQRKMADEQKRMADAQRRMADDQRKMAVDMARGTLKLNFSGPAAERPVLIGTEPMTPEIETEWREDLRVMDKLLSDQLSSAAISSYPQAMGIKLWSLGQSEPMYIEGLGCVFTCRAGIPLAEGKSGATTKGTLQVQPSAWDRARREISGQGRLEYAELKLKQPQLNFDHAALDRLIESILKTLPEATNMRHLAAEQYVIVTVVGADEDGTPMRLTMKAQKNDIDGAAKGTLTADDFAKRVLHRIH